MEQALYHPKHGYYSTDRAMIGRRGDYFTNVSVGPVFGQLLTAQFAEIWMRLGQIENFTIIEQAAHHGEFARDVLRSARVQFPEFYSALRYEIVEPFSVLQDRQSQTLDEFQDRVQWRKSLAELEPFSGVHFSNELLDSMPAHLLIATESGWLEKFVALHNDEFVFVHQPVVEPRLQAALKDLPTRQIGYETEINLAALDWIDQLAPKIQRGYIVAVDYGYPREEFYAPYRIAGTLQVRAQHRNLDSPLEQIGRADITAHVEWTTFAARAEWQGLSIAGFADQHHFITGIISESGWGDLSETGAGSAFAGDCALSSAKGTRALQTLLHPEMMGRSFQTLALGKGVESRKPLSGFKFAGPPRAALGL
jgi:SAM-dependent MidA family methyltransferase